MLKGNKSTSLSYQSIIDGKPAVFMSGQIPESGSSNISKNIVDLSLYNTHKAECRQDMSDFDGLVYEIEDSRGLQEDETI